MTKKAKKLLEFLKTYLKKNSISPTYDEMREHMKLKSKSSIFQYLEYLENLGHISRDKLKSRSIKINQLIPFYNEISAGNPISLSNDLIEYVQYDELINIKDKYSFACKVNGNSMDSFGIHSGDIAIIDRNTSYNPKKIYAIQIDNSEITLKKLRVIDNEIEIIGDKKNYNSKKYNKDRVKILGKMISLIRSYK